MSKPIFWVPAKSPWAMNSNVFSVNSTCLWLPACIRGGSVAVAIVPRALHWWIFSRVDLDIFTIAWRIESGVSLRLLWHVPFSQQKLLAILVFEPVWFQNSVTVRRRLFKCSLGTCQIHVYEIMHMNSITPIIFELGRVIVWLGWVFVPDLAGFQSHVNLFFKFPGQ
jgi:hypothetical protein